MFNTTCFVLCFHFKWISVKTFLGVCFTNEKYLQRMSPSIKVWVKAKSVYAKE